MRTGRVDSTRLSSPPHDPQVLGATRDASHAAQVLATVRRWAGTHRPHAVVLRPSSPTSDATFRAWTQLVSDTTAAFLPQHDVGMTFNLPTDVYLGQYLSSPEFMVAGAPTDSAMHHLQAPWGGVEGVVPPTPLRHPRAKLKVSLDEEEGTRVQVCAAQL